MIRTLLPAKESSSRVFPTTSYGPRVRAAHELADLLKRTRPHLFEQVDQLQETVTRCQQTLDLAQAEQGRSLPLNHKTLTTLKELETATQALLDLRHKGAMAR